MLSKCQQRYNAHKDDWQMYEYQYMSFQTVRKSAEKHINVQDPQINSLIEERVSNIVRSF